MDSTGRFLTSDLRFLASRTLTRRFAKGDHGQGYRNQNEQQCYEGKIGVQDEADDEGKPGEGGALPSGEPAFRRRGFFLGAFNLIQCGSLGEARHGFDRQALVSCGRYSLARSLFLTFSEDLLDLKLVPLL